MRNIIRLAIAIGIIVVVVYAALALLGFHDQGRTSDSHTCIYCVHDLCTGHGKKTEF